VAEPLLDLFAICAPGLETVTAAELGALGIEGTSDSGGVEWTGTPAQLYDANLRLRTAGRVIARIARFRARTFFELERHGGKVPWDRIVATGARVAFRVTCRKSRLYHEGAVAQRLFDAVRAAVGPIEEAAPSDNEDDDADDVQLFIVRFVRDVCTISADSSGAMLHRRGYRQATAKAPLRETLAAAMLQASGWRFDSPVVDPFCGAGTIQIEAALLARAIPPGLAGETPRRFAFQAWPTFDARAWREVIDRARAGQREAAAAPIIASDRDAGAIASARGNAERAGVSGDIEFAIRPISAVQAVPGPGWIVSNPPWGVRVGEARALRDLYAVLGNVARDRFPGWSVALLGADDSLLAATGLQLSTIFSTRSGGIPIRLAGGLAS
jgi:putative N6-adenine-specific DNA methylase